MRGRGGCASGSTSDSNPAFQLRVELVSDVVNRVTGKRNEDERVRVPAASNQGQCSTP